jgi:hypothetical protein
MPRKRPKVKSVLDRKKWYQVRAHPKDPRNAIFLDQTLSECWALPPKQKGACVDWVSFSFPCPVCFVCLCEFVRLA